MRKALKLAAVVGGIGALAWGMRKRIRIAVRRGEVEDPEFRIIDPPPAPADEEAPVAGEAHLSEVADPGDGAADPAAGEEPDDSSSGDSGDAG